MVGGWNFKQKQQLMTHKIRGGAGNPGKQAKSEIEI